MYSDKVTVGTLMRNVRKAELRPIDIQALKEPEFLSDRGMELFLMTLEDVWHAAIELQRVADFANFIELMFARYRVGEKRAPAQHVVDSIDVEIAHFDMLITEARRTLDFWESNNDQ